MTHNLVEEIKKIQPESLQESVQRAVEILDTQEIFQHGKRVPFSYIPLVIDNDHLEFFNKVLKVTDSILAKITRHYVSNPEYRKIFGFSKQLEDLITLPCQYEETIPVGRYDMFYNDQTKEFSFIEFNTDGSGGMSRDLEISKAILETFPDHNYVKDHNLSVFNSIENIAKNLADIYKADTGCVKNPTIAVVDWREEGVMSDFKRFIDQFEKLGFSARFTDIRNLKFTGDALIDTTDGRIINAVYRRAVTSVIMDRYEDAKQLIEAVKAKKVCLMGHFRTSIAHSKLIFLIMHHPQTLQLLTPEEADFVRRHIPETYRLTSDMDADLLRRIKTWKHCWIIKPEDDFGSHGVLSGMDVSSEEWEGYINKVTDKGYIVQKFVQRYSYDFLSSVDSKLFTLPLMLGIYTSKSQVAGFYSRAGLEGVIDFDHGGICVSTLRTTD